MLSVCWANCPAPNRMDHITARSGTATPDGPVAVGEITFEGPPCVNGYATVKGMIGIDLQARKIIAAGFSHDRNHGYVFIGQR